MNQQENQEPTGKSSRFFSKRTIFWGLVGGFVVANALVYKHAYHFTHANEDQRSLSPEDMTTWQKLKILLEGISLPKSKNLTLETTQLSNRQTFLIPTRKNKYNLEAWFDEVAHSKGIILLFHGYGGCKSSYELEADYFRELGFSTLLVDFVGHGGSEGTEISLGYHEADDVKACVDYLTTKFPSQHINLFGSSMGAAAILRAMAVYKLPIHKLLLECPFATMKQTVKGRFEVMGIPSGGFAEWLMFWGGIQHGFWAFSHNPQEYAKHVMTPTLLMGGKDDARVKNWEIMHIYDHLKGEKYLQWMQAGHESYILKDPLMWKKAIAEFLE